MRRYDVQPAVHRKAERVESWGLLTHVFERIADHPVNRIDELLL